MQSPPTLTPTPTANGLAFTVDSLYVTGPDAGQSFARFNRTTGELMHTFYDQSLHDATDLQEYNDYIYIVSGSQVRKYNRLNGEFVKVFSTATHNSNESNTEAAQFSCLYFHTKYTPRTGE